MKKRFLFSSAIVVALTSLSFFVSSYSKINRNEEIFHNCIFTVKTSANVTLKMCGSFAGSGAACSNSCGPGKEKGGPFTANVPQSFGFQSAGNGHAKVLNPGVSSVTVSAKVCSSCPWQVVTLGGGQYYVFTANSTCTGPGAECE